MAAKHQHYVPRLLLRGFLSKQGGEADKERVRVLDMNEDREFVTSIDNVMGEGRFNDFWIDEETLATLDPVCDRIETHISPLVQRIRAEKRLNVTSEEIADLSLLIAFQFVRTKKMRLLPERLNSQMLAHVTKMGFDPAKVGGLVDWDEDKLKAAHARHQIKNLQAYVDLISEKMLFLMIPPNGSSFYLGDHPVVLHNDEPASGVMGRLGLGAPYVQIYLPLAADLLLCAYCPAVFGQLMKAEKKEQEERASYALRALMNGKITGERMRELLELGKSFDLATPMVSHIRKGKPVEIDVEQVQAYNSLQAFQAHRYVVDPDGKFEVAREMMAERNAADSDGAASIDLF